MRWLLAIAILVCAVGCAGPLPPVSLTPKLAAVTFADSADLVREFRGRGGDPARYPRGFYDPANGEIWVARCESIEILERTLGHELLHALGFRHDGRGAWDRSPMEARPCR